MMLVISVVLAVVPLFGIVWTIATGTITTQDGLFMSLISLAVSGLFALNAYWELRDSGALALLRKRKAGEGPASAASAKTTVRTTEKTVPEGKDATLTAGRR